uniref:Uncharacterized protein n=1 Tax=Schistocephalus solidus TaxID=70667 RepID=A0A0X3PFB2_SCHSO
MSSLLMWNPYIRGIRKLVSEKDKLSCPVEVCTSSQRDIWLIYLGSFFDRTVLLELHPSFCFLNEASTFRTQSQHMSICRATISSTPLSHTTEKGEYEMETNHQSAKVL